MKNYLVLLTLVFISLPVQAETKNVKLWIANDGGLSRDYVTNGEIRGKEGFFGGFELRELMAGHPEALALVDKQGQFNTYTHIAYWAGVLPSATVLGLGLGQPNSAITIVGLTTFVATTLLTFYFASESRHYMYAAINTYNGVIPSGSTAQREHQTPLEFAAAASQANQLKLNFNF